MSKQLNELRLGQDFFKSLFVKKLRRSKYGDLAAVIYLKMLLASNNNGVIELEGVCEDAFEELALTIDEEYETVEGVCTLLLKMGRFEIVKGGEKHGSARIFCVL